jgi:radical SAM superfamily enzyme YgiQ (UPF0313 family)
LTGQAEPLKPDELEMPDYGLLERYSLLDTYLTDPLSRPDFLSDARSFRPQRAGKKMAVIFTQKGCVNKCTFCHRWIGGYRLIPVGKVIASMKLLIEKHNVGFFYLSDECFGEHRGWLEEFMAAVKPLDILYLVGGARVSIVRKDPGLIRRLKDSGMSAIYFGMESGSDKILAVMQKNATREENLQAARACAEAGVFSAIQLVIGLPGEDEGTISETIDFVNRATGGLPFLPEPSVNYLQSLPGTPCYELLRRRGLLGRGVEGEEEYLLKVSDVNAAEFSQYINVSQAPLSKVRLWKMRIVISCRINWLKNHGWRFKLLQGSSAGKGLKYNALVYRAIDLMGGLFWKLAYFTVKG